MQCVQNRTLVLEDDFTNCRLLYNTTVAWSIFILLQNTHYFDHKPNSIKNKSSGVDGFISRNCARPSVGANAPFYSFLINKQVINKSNVRYLNVRFLSIFTVTHVYFTTLSSFQHL